MTPSLRALRVHIMRSALIMGPMEQVLHELNRSMRIASILMDSTLRLPASVPQKPAATGMRRRPARSKPRTPAGKTSSTCVIMVGSAADKKQPVPAMQPTGPGARLQLVTGPPYARTESSADLHAAGLHYAREPDVDSVTARSHILEQCEQVEGLEFENLQLHSEISGLREQVRSLMSQLQFKDGLLLQAQQALSCSSEVQSTVHGSAVSHYQAMTKAPMSPHRNKRTPAPAPATPTAIVRPSPAASTTPSFCKSPGAPVTGSHAARKPKAAQVATPVWRAAGPGGGAFTPLRHVPRYCDVTTSTAQRVSTPSKGATSQPTWH